MSAQNQKNLIKKFVSLVGVASASVLLGFPALALTNTNSSNFNSSPNNRIRRVESAERNRQLIAQGTSGTGGTGTGQSGTGGTGTGGTGTGGTGQPGTGGTGTGGTGQPGTGGAGTGGTGTGGTGQPGTGGTGTGGTGQPGTGGTGTGGTGQPGTGGTGTGGTGQPGTGGTGTGGTGTGGTGQPGTGGTGTGGTGTGGTGQPGTSGTGTGGTGSTNGQPNSQQDAFTQNMNAGYAATQQRDYRTALTNFQRALQLRPNNPYAIRAVRNVQGYLQRSNTTTPTNRTSR